MGINLERYFCDNVGYDLKWNENLVLSNELIKVEFPPLKDCGSVLVEGVEDHKKKTTKKTKTKKQESHYATRT